MRSVDELTKKPPEAILGYRSLLTASANERIPMDIATGKLHEVQDHHHHHQDVVVKTSFLDRLVKRLGA